MTPRILNYLCLCLILTGSIISGPNISAAVVSYPAPPGLKTSPDFTLNAAGTNIWVERIGSKKTSFDYNLYSGRAMEDLNVASFSCSGKVTIKITASENISSFKILPESRHIAGMVNGKDLTFTISGPQKLYIEINNLPHLAIFANPEEEDIPSGNTPGVTCFTPGSYNLGTITLKSNQTIYIAGGAIVYADIKGRNLKNVCIKGRGIIQGNIDISGTENLLVEGVFIRNTNGWTNTLTDCYKSKYLNVKVFSYEAIYSVDGIDIVSCRNFIIDDCFMRCRDDCVAIKSGDKKLHVDSISVGNCVMTGWACSDGVTIGFELNGGPVENIYVKNCDILYARGGGRTDGHSGFSIVCDGPALVRNIYFEDIRVEKQVEFKNLELIVTDGTLYGDDPPGHIKGVNMKNITWANPDKPFIIKGFSPSNMVEDIVFDHCTVGGKLLKSTSDADFRINSYAKNIVFK